MPSVCCIGMPLYYLKLVDSRMVTDYGLMGWRTLRLDKLRRSISRDRCAKLVPNLSASTIQYPCQWMAGAVCALTLGGNLTHAGSFVLFVCSPMGDLSGWGRDA
jgi:hypothetical protein